MKTTHTHRGHCQACGRVHAVDTAKNLLAKHGYTVEFGYFDGVCTGSDRKPLEVDKSFTEATIVRIYEWIDGQKVLLQEAIEGRKTFSHYTLEKTKNGFRFHPFSDKHFMVQGLTIVEYTEENLRKHCEEYNQKMLIMISFNEIFLKLQNHYIKSIENGIANAFKHIDSLQKLIEEVHGKELINVADTEKLLKDLEAEAKIGFNETFTYEGETLGRSFTQERFVSVEKEATKKTSIGLVGIKVSRPSVYVRYSDRVSVNCLLNGKRIARNKLIQKLQGDI
tara:strand:- start:625 stop:1464 length:840 start_codon:yes stop_codon:yes gene_type:complete